MSWEQWAFLAGVAAAVFAALRWRAAVRHRRRVAAIKRALQASAWRAAGEARR